MLRTLAAFCLMVLVSLPAMAGDRSLLGYGRLITNDSLADGRDRWQSGSISSSHVWGPAWQGHAPARFGKVLEMRLGAAIMSPQRLTNPAPSDRPFAGALSLGVHTHARLRRLDISAGADVVLTGPSTGLGSLQRELHELIDVNPSSDAVLDAQIPDGVHLSVVAEAARDIAFGANTRLRPFVEARAGVETMLRAGVDLTVGQLGQAELWVRDPVTGQRYRVIQNSDPGFSFVMGGDVARVTDSIYLPASRGITLSDTRNRLRAGIHWQGEQASAFYGLTWLGEEFEGQGGNQVVGSVRVRLRF